jgi:uncharacterized membrane protein YdfJ with MMPL/SSD domain
VSAVPDRAARWVLSHARLVTGGWLVLLVVVMAVSHAAKPHYVNNLALPGTDSQRATPQCARASRGCCSTSPT